MTDRPVVVSDVLVGGGGSDDDDDDALTAPAADGRRRALALVLAAGLGFAVAQLVPTLEPPRATAASLALVTGRQPWFEATADEPPTTGLEVTLVNTGTTALRLDRAVVEGTDLRWDVDRPLEPGRQAPALLRDAQPCDGPLDELSGRRPAAQVRLTARDEQTGDPLPDVLLALPPSVGRPYDEHVRLTCALPRLGEAVEPSTLAPELIGDELVVGFGLQSRSVRDVQVVDVAAAVDGVTARLTAADGEPVALPLAVPGRPRRELAQGYGEDPGRAPYRLRLTARPEACAVLREPSDAWTVLVRWVDQDEPEDQAERPVLVDLTLLVGQVCPSPR